MPQIQRIPEGLISLLGLVGEQAPSDVNDRVVPEVELLPFYVAKLWETQQTSASVQNVGDTVTLEVPTRQFWLCQAVGVRFDLAASGEFGFFAIGWRPQTQSGIFVPIAREQRVVGATEIVRFGTQFQTPVLIPPGGALQVVLTRTNAAARTMNLAAIVAPLNV